MKIAFVGKGGSGKSTVASLFIRYLFEKGQTILAVDADINMHLGMMLGVEHSSALHISLPENARRIRLYLRGINPRIPSEDHFVKTTPPGNGSGLIFIEKSNPVLRDYATVFSDRTFFLQVGTYEKGRVGMSCYHSNLSVLENILSHSVTKPDEWIVADMVAGVDAFAGTLHAQFDALLLVVEPTPEGIEVFHQYLALAESAGVSDNIFVIGNKVMDDDEISYLSSRVGKRLIATILLDFHFRKARREGRLPDLSLVNANAAFDALIERIQKNCTDPNKKLALLQDLHKRIAEEDWVKNSIGDVTSQIDPSFHFTSI